MVYYQLFILGVTLGIMYLIYDLFLYEIFVNDFVAIGINEYKVRHYSNNRYLYSIPHQRMVQERNRLRQKYSLIKYLIYKYYGFKFC